jgi:hypothetical protein
MTQRYLSFLTTNGKVQIQITVRKSCHTIDRDHDDYDEIMHDNTTSYGVLYSKQEPAAGS